MPMVCFFWSGVSASDVACDINVKGASRFCCRGDDRDSESVPEIGGDTDWHFTIPPGDNCVTGCMR